MKIDLVFLIILGIVIAYVFALYKIESMIDLSNTKQIEHMADVTDAQIAEAVKKYYLSDEFIKNISIVSAQIQKDGLTVSGNLSTNIINATDNINVSNKTNEGGRIRILNELKNGKADQTNDWSIWNMTGPYGNKLAFWRYNGDGKNVGSALDIFDNGTVTVNGPIKANTLNLGNTMITEDILKRIINQQSYAGFAVNGGGTTMPLYEGQYNLTGGQLFDAASGNQDTWDVIYINRGWRITVWDGVNFQSQLGVLENKTSNVPIKLEITNDKASSYKAEWIGY
jgi:hypothetical protein